MSRLRVPIISTVIGEGGSGGALAIGVGNRVLMLENSIYSVISPEGCASILYRDASKAEKAADALKLTAKDLLELKVIDEVIPEPAGGAHRDPARAAENLGRVAAQAPGGALRADGDELVEDRYEKFRALGAFSGRWRMAMRPFIVAIDGPAGAGKSTVSKLLARRLGLAFVDTGALYRAVALWPRRRGHSPPTTRRSGSCSGGSASTSRQWGGEPRLPRRRGRVGGDPHAGHLAGGLAVSGRPVVREGLLALQRRLALEAPEGAMLEGRDIGTVVFPDADPSSSSRPAPTCGPAAATRSCSRRAWRAPWTRCSPTRSSATGTTPRAPWPR